MCYVITSLGVILRLIIWALREYEEIEPIMLCVDEKDEISIGDVALKILEAFDFKVSLIWMHPK